MGNDVAEVVEEGLPSPRMFKVHGRMCSELLKVINRVSKIFPEIEGARPGCSSGMAALCLLNSAIDKAKTLLRHCSESSALYLALTGDAILSRCKKSRNLLDQSLSQIQNMVPVMLAAKISGVVADLRSVAFCLDPSEEEAGQVLRELLHRYGSTTDSSIENALADIHIVSSRLHISSHKAVLTEKRSIKNLLNKIGEKEPSKRKILLLFLNLLNKYGKTIAQDQGDNEDRFPLASPYHHLSDEMELSVNYKSNEDQTQIDMLSRRVPPQEFICPLSLRTMRDPVIIASGQTYERASIQKWFDEGHTTCPKTKMTLSHLSFTSNTVMKELILKWSALHGGVSYPVPQFQGVLSNSWENSTNSIASLSGFMNDLNFPDFSNVTFGSSNDVKQPSSHDIDMEFLSRFSTLSSWDSRCKAVEDVTRLLNQSDVSCLVPLGEFVQLVLDFLKNAHDLGDVEALLNGCQLLLELVQKYRNSTSHIKEDTYDLLASFLDTNASKQALSILEVLSSHEQCVHWIASSSALLIGISNILDSQIQELLEPTLHIMTNLSSNCDITSVVTPSEFIPKVAPFLEDDTLARYCITILKNMCDNGDAQVSIAETQGCVASIARLLEKDSNEEQEHAVSVLLSLCLQRTEICQLVMDEGIMGIVSISINGNRKAKAAAMELLRIMREDRITSEESPVMDVCVDSSIKETKDKKPPKPQGLFGKLFSSKKKK